MIALYVSCAKKETQTQNLTEKEQAIKDYKELYVGSTVTDTELAWSGNLANCNEGTISQIALDKTLKRVNYFRKICGLPNNMVWNTAHMLPSQKSALIMSANNSLSHFPTSSWKCYSTEGADASGNGNIALGTHSSESITAWIEDAGGSNYRTGHRRWILFSRAQDFGFGSTSNASTLYCISNTDAALASNVPTYITYPPKYIAQELAFDRWSMGVANPISFYSGVDFSNATVTMTSSSGENLAVTIVSKTDNGYGDQTIVWEPTGVIKDATGDVSYHVVIDNFTVNGVAKKHEYDVTIFKP